MRVFDPFEELRRMQERISRLVDEFDRFSVPIAERSFAAPVDVIDESDRVRVVVDLPGFEKDDISVYIEDGDLVVKAKRGEEKEEKGRNYLRRERSYGEVYRRISLPSDVDEERIKARYRNGVLEVELPKEQRAKREIKID